MASENTINIRLNNLLPHNKENKTTTNNPTQRDRLTAAAMQDSSSPFYMQNLSDIDIQDIKSKENFKMLDEHILKLKQELVKFVKTHTNTAIDSSTLEPFINNLNTIDKINYAVLKNDLEDLINILNKHTNSDNKNKLIHSLNNFFSNLKHNQELIKDIVLIIAALGFKQGAWYGTQFIKKDLSMLEEMVINYGIALFEFIPSIIALSSLIKNKFDISVLNSLIISLDLSFLFIIQNILNKELMKPKHYIALSLSILSSLVLNNFHSSVFKLLKNNNIKENIDINVNHTDVEAGHNNLTPRKTLQGMKNLTQILDKLLTVEDKLNKVSIDAGKINNILQILKQHNSELTAEDNQFIEDLSNKLLSLNTSINDVNQILSEFTNYMHQQAITAIQMAKNKPYYGQHIFFILSSIAYTVLLSTSLSIKNSDNQISLAATASIFARIPAWFFFASKNDTELKEFLSEIKEITKKIYNIIAPKKLNLMLEDTYNKLLTLISSTDNALHKLVHNFPNNLEKNSLMSIRIGASWGIFALIEYIALSIAHHKAKQTKFNLITPRVQMEFAASAVSGLFDIVVMAKTLTKQDKINLFLGLLIGISAVIVTGVIEE